MKISYLYVNLNKNKVAWIYDGATKKTCNNNILRRPLRQRMRYLRLYKKICKSPITDDVHFPLDFIPLLYYFSYVNILAVIPSQSFQFPFFLRRRC